MNLKKTKEVEKLQFVERMRYKKTYCRFYARVT